MSAEANHGQYMDCEAARQYYGLSDRASLLASDLHNQVAAAGVAQVDIARLGSSFADLVSLFDVAVEDSPGQLAKTSHRVDYRRGHEAGYERKERVISAKTGEQIQDPKHLFHFNEEANNRWRSEFAVAPVAIRGFLEAGFDLHRDLIQVAREQYALLEETHPNISEVYFPSTAGPSSMTYMRVIGYDPYDVDAADSSVVAKPHFDISAGTIQAYADAPGFWGAPDRGQGQTYYQSDEGMAQFFMGMGHRKLYGDTALLQPLYHGVDRVVPPNTTRVPSRHAVILFINAPYIDPAISNTETIPYLAAES